jgi:hypothetical protein
MDETDSHCPGSRWEPGSVTERIPQGTAFEPEFHAKKETIEIHSEQTLADLPERHGGAMELPAVARGSGSGSETDNQSQSWRWTEDSGDPNHKRSGQLLSWGGIFSSFNLKRVNRGVY